MIGCLLLDLGGWFKYWDLRDLRKASVDLAEHMLAGSAFHSLFRRVW